MRFALHELGLAGRVRFHHDGFEFNDGRRPPHDFDLARRRARCRAAGPTIYLTREPRDVLVSLYHQVTGRFGDIFGYRGTLAEFVRDPYFGAGPLQRFREQWEALCGEGLARRISYEDCHRDFAAVLRAVLGHYGVGVPDAELRAVVERAGFESMRRIEESGTFDRHWLQARNAAPKVRRGVVGGYLTELSAADRRHLDAVFGPAAAPG
jgi:hypothetical protein